MVVLHGRCSHPSSYENFEPSNWRYLHSNPYVLHGASDGGRAMRCGLRHRVCCRRPRVRSGTSIRSRPALRLAAGVLRLETSGASARASYYQEFDTLLIPTNLTIEARVRFV